MKRSDRLTGILLLAALFLSAAHDASCDGVPRIFVTEDHSQALCLWYKAGIRGANVLHLDAHPDLYSPTVRIEAPVQEVKQALDGHTCPDLEARTGFLVRTDALYGIGDFLTVAHALGVVSRVTWVLPMKGPLDGEGYRSFLSLVHRHFPPGFPEETTFDGSSLSGDLDGLDITITTLEQMAWGKDPVLLDIEVDWFPAIEQVSGDTDTGGHLGSLAGMLKALETVSDPVTISASTRGGYTPLEYRHLRSTVREMVENPAGRTGPAWDAAPESGSAGDFYRMAAARAREGDVGGMLGALRKAVDLDPGYAPGYAVLSTALETSAGQGAAIKLLEAGVRERPGDLTLALSIGNRCLEIGEWERAEAVFREALSGDGKVPAFHAGLAFALRGLGRQKEAQTAMDRFRETAHQGEYREGVLQRWEETQDAGHSTQDAVDP